MWKVKFLLGWAHHSTTGVRSQAEGRFTHNAKVTRQAGLTAQVEQKMLIQGQTQEDGEPASGSVRPLHRADVHIIEPSGSEIWTDARTHTACVDQPIGRDLLKEEQQKCRAYGQTTGYDINRPDQGMIPVSAPAKALFQRLLHHCTQSLVRQGLGLSLSVSPFPLNSSQLARPDLSWEDPSARSRRF